MAVWIYAYGENKLQGRNEEALDRLRSLDLEEVRFIESLQEILPVESEVTKHYRQNRKSIEANMASKSDEAYRTYLNSIKIPYTEREKLVDLFIEKADERHKKYTDRIALLHEQFRSGKIRSKWEIVDGGFFNAMGYFNRNDGLRIRCQNDLVWMAGSFDIFSLYHRFLDDISKESREYYHRIFKAICRVFESNFILYTHEWAGIDDEEDPDFNLSQLMYNTDNGSISSSSLHEMKDCYYEKL